MHRRTTTLNCVLKSDHVTPQTTWNNKTTGDSRQGPLQMFLDGNQDTRSVVWNTGNQDEEVLPRQCSWQPQTGINQTTCGGSSETISDPVWCLRQDVVRFQWISLYTTNLFVRILIANWNYCLFLCGTCLVFCKTQRRT